VSPAHNLTPFGLSLSKVRFCFFGASRQGQGFDKLSPNGVLHGRKAK